MEGYSAIQRSSGQTCTPVDVIANDATIRALGNSILATVITWESLITAIRDGIVTNDADTTRQTQNNTAISDINNTLSIIDTWQAYAEWDTTHGQITCVGFNGYNVALLAATNFRAAELNVLKTEITARSSFITTRLSQLATNLGSVTQNYTTGAVSAVAGYWGDRFNIIDLRLNLVTGTLRRLEGIKLGKKAQDEAITSNAVALAVYSAVMKAISFRAPSIGTNIINVKSATGFAVSDAVYIVADTQNEISTTITAITGDTITLGVNIPSKYRQDDNARMYKML
jgi:hypothetical protein